MSMAKHWPVHLARWWRGRPNYIISTPDVVPLTQRIDHFQTKKEHAELLAACKASIADNGDDENALSEGGFSGTKGWVACFSAEGAATQLEDTCGSELYRFFDRARLPGMNAFVMNVLSVPSGDCGRGGCVKMHLDDTVKLEPAPLKVFPWLNTGDWNTVLADTVSVLYLDMPEDMEGGHLEVFEHERGIKNSGHGDEVWAVPCERVTPASNTLVRFRGDAFHRVAPFTSGPESADRLSVVLEQYQLCPEAQARAVEFQLLEPSSSYDSSYELIHQRASVGLRMGSFWEKDFTFMQGPVGKATPLLPGGDESMVQGGAPVWNGVDLSELGYQKATTTKPDFTGSAGIGSRREASCRGTWEAGGPDVYFLGPYGRLGPQALNLDKRTYASSLY